MRKETALGARQRGAHDDAVMRKRIVNDEILWPKQSTDRGNIGRVPTDESNAGFLLVMGGESSLELAMQRTLAGNEPACRTGRAVLLDCGGGCSLHFRMAVQTEVVIGRIIIVFTTIDDRGCPGARVMQAEKRVVYPDNSAEGALQADFVHARKRVEVDHRSKPLIDDGQRTALLAFDAETVDHGVF